MIQRTLIYIALILGLLGVCKWAPAAQAPICQVSISTGATDLRTKINTHLGNAETELDLANNGAKTAN